MTWLRFQWSLYFGNAGAQRDFRAQMRGAKAPLYWTLYLGLLIMAFMIFYFSTWREGSMSVAQMQSQLQGFYYGLVMMLEMAVGLAAPVLAASSVVAEYQRRSMELLMAAPVTPRYFLVGKLVSSYRYVWMLLALSLPLTAACIVMGGTTWVQVLETYFIISLHGLLYASIGLMLGVLSQKPIPAVAYSLIAVLLYSMVGTAISGAAIFGAFSGLGADPTMAMVPGGSIMAAGTSTPIFGAAVPNWLIALLATLCLVSMNLLGAGSGLSRFGAPIIRKFRIFGLVMLLLLGAFVGYTVGTSMSFSGVELAVSLSVVTMLLVPVLCYTAVWSIYAERKYAPQSMLHWRNTLRGGSGSALPYITAMFAAMMLGLGGVLLYNNVTLDDKFWAVTFWLAAIWIFLYALARCASAWNKGDLRTARALFVALLCAFVMLPVPVLVITQNYFDGPQRSDEVMALVYPFAAGFANQTNTTLGGGLILAVVSGILLTMSERTRRKRNADVGVLT